MLKEKLFPLKISSDGRFALKEETLQHLKGEKTKIKVTFALDSELRIIDPYIFDKGFFIDASAVADIRGMTTQDFVTECKLTSNPIYYTLDSLTYICVQNIFMERGVVVKNSINLYIPLRYENSKLVCNDVTVVFPLQNRNVLSNNYQSFSLSRIK